MLILKKVTKYFNKGTINEVLATKDLDLIVERGDFISIIGSNGAGKSTLLNCIAGGFQPDAGRIIVAEKDVTAWPEFKRASLIGRVFQDPLKGTCAALTIEQNMALAALRGKRRGLHRGVKPQDRERFQDELKKIGLGLENRLQDVVGLLSGGQRQSLTMLMATLVRPKLLLLDEHTAALDPKTALQIMDLTQQLVEEQKLTTLMVTHNMQQAIAFGNRLVMMHQGEVILDIEGKEKQSLTVDDLLDRFHSLRGDGVVSDRLLLG